MTEGNNFGALRLLAAGLVVFGHCFVLTGQAAPRWFGVPVHELAVHVFFVISGYLMAASWRSDPSLPRFVLRRALRIMPALVAVVLACVLVLGPLFTSLPLRDYALHPQTRLYLWNLVLAPYFALPGVFEEGRPFGAVNGSLWSLPIEVAMYAWTPLLAARAAWVRTVLPLLLLAALAAAFVFTAVRPHQVEPVIYWSSVPFGLRYAADFALAAAIRSRGLERLLSLQAALGVLLLLGLLPVGPVLSGVLLLAMPYVVLSVALARPPLLPGLGRRIDLSYGIYLWSGPVQQVLISAMGVAIGPWLLLATALPASALLAWGSWRWVEQPFLRMKPRRAPAGATYLAPS